MADISGSLRGALAHDATRGKKSSPNAGFDKQPSPMAKDVFTFPSKQKTRDAAVKKQISNDKL